MRTSHLLPALAVLMVISSCRKEEPDTAVGPGGSGGASHHPIDVGTAVQTRVSGQVLDEAGVPIPGALVKAGFGTQSTITDANGVFSLGPIAAYAGLGYVKIEKAGYFNGSRSFLPLSGANRVEYTLLPRTSAGTVSGVDGGTVTAHGAVLDLPAAGFVRNGEAYTGAVHVAMDRIDPTTTGANREMPGMLLGAAGSNARVLTSYGMVVVELTDDAGGPVGIAPGSRAVVHLPVSAGLATTAPATIDLWHFDDALGYWIKEGVGTLDGGAYVMEVAHFSWWNVDVPAALVTLNGLVLDGAGHPVQGALVLVSDGIGVRDVLTGTSGEFGGYVPRDTELTLTVVLRCSNTTETEIHQQVVGPLAVNTTLATIIMDDPQSTEVSGTVTDCADTPVVNGYVEAGGLVHFCVNGAFSFVTCANSAAITAYDQDHLAHSAPMTVTYPDGSYATGTIQACDPGVLLGSVTDVDGNQYVTVQMGGQEWMTQELRTTRYADGTPIPEVTTDVEWVNLHAGAWTHYANDAQYEVPFGKLYNWYAVTDPRNVCPTGWHVPTDGEWTELVDRLGGVEFAGGRMKTAGVVGAGTGLWNAPNVGATNHSGFSGRPGGGRYANGSFYMGDIGYWWSATAYDTNFAYYLALRNDTAAVLRMFNAKTIGNSVRCVRD